MKILVAPDKFKGSLTAARVAEALARGARRVHPEAAFSLRPMADGGEGTLDAFVVALGGRVREIHVTDPYGGRVVAPIARLDNGEVVVEMAATSGLHVATNTDKRSALTATSRGTGELIREALGANEATRVIVGVGGSLSTDGGTGAATALGWRFVDDAGRDLSPGGGSLDRLHAIEGDGELFPSRVDIVAACDVDNPLTGARGSARIFAPQKGASPADVARLERGLERLATVVERDLGTAIASLPHGGAGGGLAAGLVAFFGATLQSGFELLAATTHLEDEIVDADLVITGEGRLDAQSLGGKTPVAVARMAARHNKPCIAVAGDLALDRSRLKRSGIESAIGLVQSGGEERAARDPAGAVEAAVEGLLRHRLERSRGSPLARRSRSGHVNPRYC